MEQVLGKLHSNQCGERVAMASCILLMPSCSSRLDVPSLSLNTSPSRDPFQITNNAIINNDGSSSSNNNNNGQNASTSYSHSLGDGFDSRASGIRSVSSSRRKGFLEKSPVSAQQLDGALSRLLRPEPRRREKPVLNRQERQDAVDSVVAAVPALDTVRFKLNHADFCANLRRFGELQKWQQASLKKGYKGEKVYTARDIALGLIDVFGWSVEVDGKGEVGKVDEIVHIGRAGARIGIDTPYEYILKVVQPLSSWDKFDVSSEASVATVLEHFKSTDIEGSSGVKILIPIVDEFMQHVDIKRRCLRVKPPAGLLELATRPEAIKRIHPEIQLFCQRYASLLQERFSGNKKINYNGSVDLQEIVHLYMPTRDQLLAVGRSDLVRRIRAAGGFLYVAHALGLKSTRRPNGFWDDLEKLDFEIECFLLESWVKQVHKETGITYFENLVTKQVAVEKPVHNNSYKSSPVNYNGLRVMPQQKLLWKACRWDLHHAIISNGGYKEVGHVLGRSVIRRTKKVRQQQMDMLNLLVANHISSTECNAP